ncbi:MAG: tetratricopeptide repeat protein [Deltaproteobacteria bacterium]|nr:tetratricopeptide repeat protein [Deltaproteobacteria bacterium]
MSYINDALQKAQKEKESRYVAYGNIVSASRKKLNRPNRWLSITGILIVFFWAAGITAVLYWPEDKKISAASVAAPAVVSVTPAEPQTAIETIAKKEEKTGLKTKTAPAEIKVKPEIADSGIIYAKAFQKHKEGKLEEAKSLYKKVIEIDPRNIQALNNLGVIYMTKKAYKWAIMRFNDAISIKHDYPDAHYNLACLYAQRNDAARSLFYLKNAVQFNPEVRKWAENDGDLRVMADLPEFKKLLEKK